LSPDGNFNTWVKNAISMPNLSYHIKTGDIKGHDLGIGCCCLDTNLSQAVGT
jgi:hypothetical protein